MPSTKTLDRPTQTTTPPRPSDREPWRTHAPTVAQPGIGGILTDKAFHPGTFESTLRAGVDGRCIGYAFAMTKNGQLALSGFGGKSRIGGDGDVDQGPTKRMNLASISKVLTAAAALKICKQYSVPLTATVGGYLPSTWDLDSEMEKITFEQLLTHTTGLGTVNANTSYANMRETMEKGAAASQPPSGPMPSPNRKYDNRHLALFRILIPYIVCKALITQFENQGDAEMSKKTGQFYIDCMRYFVFDPIGIGAADMKPDGDSQQTLLYSFPDDGDAGSDGGDWTEIGAGGGWVLSAYDLAKFLAYLGYSDKILSADQRAEMDSKRYGWWTHAGEGGVTYLKHDGGISWGGGAMNGSIMKFPGNIEAVLLVNSDLEGANTEDVLAAAFEAANP